MKQYPKVQIFVIMMESIHLYCFVYIELFRFVFVHFAAKEEAQEKQEIWLM